MKLFTQVIFPVLALTCLSLGLGSAAQAESRRHDNNSYKDSYYARTNPHYGKVDSDGILSPGELRNPLINYRGNNNYGQDRHDCDYKKPYQSNGWQNYAEKRPTYNYGRPIAPKPYWSPYYR